MLSRPWLLLWACDSPWEPPVAFVVEAAELVPPSFCLPPIRPDRPPTAAHPARAEEPEAVPGSRNASSRNNANGANAEVAISMVEANAVPIEAATPSDRPAATPLAIWIPMPSTSTTTVGVNAAAWNQRASFHSQVCPTSDTRPAAAIGLVTASTIRAAPRATMIRKNAIAAITRKPAQNPNTVASTASVTSSNANGVHGWNSRHVVTPSSGCINERVIAEAAARTATM